MNTNRKWFGGALGFGLALFCALAIAAVPGIFSHVNSNTGYQVNGTAGLSGYALCSDGTNYVNACAIPAPPSNACTAYSSNASTGCTVMADGKWMIWATTPSQTDNFTGEVTVTLPVAFPTACFTANFVTNIGATISHDGQGYNNYLGGCTTTTVTIEMETGADGVGQYAHTATAFVYGD